MKKIRCLILTIMSGGILFSYNANNKTAPANLNNASSINNNESNDSHKITFDANGGKWKDGSTTKEVMTEDGKLPVEPTEKPTKTDEKGYKYTFTGWYPNLSLAFTDATYKATYSHVEETYTVTWYAQDGKTVLETDKNVPYGAAPSFDGTIPTVEGYYFANWMNVESGQPGLGPVIGNSKYVAAYLPYPVPHHDVCVQLSNCSVSFLDDPTCFFQRVTKDFKLGDEVKLHLHSTVDRSGKISKLPKTIRFMVDEETSTDYEYDNETGLITFTVKGETSIIAVGKIPAGDVTLDFSLVDATQNTVTIDFSVDDESSIIKTGIAWGDGSSSIDDGSHKLSHTYTFEEPKDYEIEIMGNVSKIRLSDTNGPLSSGNNYIKSITFIHALYYPLGEEPGIDEYAFNGCRSLQHVNLPSVAKDPSYKEASIGMRAFQNCQSLLEFKVPQNITSIGIQVFDGCTSLKDLFVHHDNPVFTSRDGDNNEANVIAKISSDSNGEKNTVIYYGRRNTDFSKFPGKVELDRYAFEDSPFITEVNFSDNLTTVGTGTFRNCSNLTTVRHENSPLTTYSDHLFEDCTSLSSVDFNGIVKIGACTFEDCTALTSISLPKSLKEIAGSNDNSGSFYNCSNLYFVDLVHVGEPDDPTSDYAIPTIGQYAFNGCTSLLDGISFLTPSNDMSLTDDPAVKARKAYAEMLGEEKLFELCGSTQTGVNYEQYKLVAFGDVVIHPGDDDSKRTVSFDTTRDVSGITQDMKFCVDWGNNAIIEVESNHSKVSFSLEYQGVDKETTYRFKVYALNTDASTVDNFNLLGSVSFTDGETGLLTKGNGNITRFSYPNPYLESGDKFSYPRIPDKAFESMTSLERLDLPRKISSESPLGENAFGLDKKLTKLVLPDISSSTASYRLPESCFLSCDNLTEVVLPSSVDIISTTCFAECEKLSKINFGTNIKQFENSSFAKCHSLTTLDLRGAKVNLSGDGIVVLDGNTSPLHDCTALTKIVVPENKIDAYKAAKYWSDYKDIIVPII